MCAVDAEPAPIPVADADAIPAPKLKLRKNWNRRRKEKDAKIGAVMSNLLTNESGDRNRTIKASDLATAAVAQAGLSKRSAEEAFGGIAKTDPRTLKKFAESIPTPMRPSVHSAYEINTTHLIVPLPSVPLIGPSGASLGPPDKGLKGVESGHE